MPLNDLSETDLLCLLALWACDEDDLNREAPSEGFMANITGMDRYSLRSHRDAMLDRADALCKQFIAMRTAEEKQSRSSKS